jgi:23S rRNA pseudouridine1911/1915/1917 synthase
MIQIFYEDDDIFIVLKPRGIPTSVGKSAVGQSVAEQAMGLCPSIALVHGYNSMDGGLLHRLDQDTEGLVLLAKHQYAFDQLRLQAQQNLFTKTYSAYSTADSASISPKGYHLAQWQKILQYNQSDGNYILECCFIKAEARSSRVKAIQHHSKHASDWYSLTYTCHTVADTIRIDVVLSRGYRHHVRASLAALGLPIIGDPLYPQPNKPNKPFYFWATGFSFRHPTSHNMVHYSYQPDLLT